MNTNISQFTPPSRLRQDVQYLKAVKINVSLFDYLEHALHPLFFMARHEQ